MITLTTNQIKSKIISFHNSLNSDTVTLQDVTDTAGNFHTATQKWYILTNTVNNKSKKFRINIIIFENLKTPKPRHTLLLESTCKRLGSKIV